MEEAPMTRIALFALVSLSACAESPKKDVATGGRTFCSISEPRWASASRDFDRHTTVEAIIALADAAKTDRGRLHAGNRNDVGGTLDDLYTHPASSAFISSGVAELATRLRQLDCAVRAGAVDFNRADQTYGKIIAELQAERSTIDPNAASAAAPRTANGG
jgi:hypothetical protein